MSLDFGVVGGLVAIIRITYEKLNDFTYRNKLKEAIFKDLDPDVNNLMEAYDEFLLNNYALIGAFILGSKIAPSNPDFISEKLVTQINNSYSKVEQSLIKAIKTMKSYGDEFKILFKSDPEQLIIYENIINLIDENKKIDYGFVVNKKSFINNLHGQSTSETFINKLNEEMNKLSCTIQVNEVNEIRNLGKTMQSLITDHQFQADLSFFTKNYLSKLEKK